LGGATGKYTKAKLMFCIARLQVDQLSIFWRPINTLPPTLIHTRGI